MTDGPIQLSIVYEVSPQHRTMPGQTVTAVSDHNGTSVTFGTKAMKLPPVVTMTSEVTITLSLDEVDQLIEILKDQRDKIAAQKERLRDLPKIAAMKPDAAKKQRPAESVSYG